MKALRLLFACLFLPALMRASAHTLTNVPMQGAMIHVGIEYHAEHGALHVHVDEGVPELVSVSQMDEHGDFDPGDPWYDDLGRAGSGLAFNRQYGFVIGGESDVLPPGTSVWIRQTSTTPGLRSYRYRGTDPKAWEPLFGTGGSGDTLEWNLIMFHPAYGAPMGSGPHQAEYEAFLVNTADGSPVEGVSAVPFTLTWSVRGQAEPTLEIALKVALSWPAPNSAYQVETAESMEGPWLPVVSEPVVIEGRHTLLVAPAHGPRFFRLQPVVQP